MFKEYPDVLDIVKMCEMLNIGVKMAYRMLKENKIAHLKVGRLYRIPKVHVIDYLLLQNDSAKK